MSDCRHELGPGSTPPTPSPRQFQPCLTGFYHIDYTLFMQSAEQLQNSKVTDISSWAKCQPELNASI